MIWAPLLDTHAWVWWINGDELLPASIRSALDELPADDRPFLSDISLWEVAMLVTLRRLQLAVPLEHWLQRAAEPRVWVPDFLAPVFRKLWHRDHPEGWRDRVSSASCGLTARRG